MNLLQQLKLYGLNPRDWTLSLKFVKPEAPLVAVLQHKEIKDLRLEGICQLQEGSPQLEFCKLSLSLF